MMRGSTRRILSRSDARLATGLPLSVAGLLILLGLAAYYTSFWPPDPFVIRALVSPLGISLGIGTHWFLGRRYSVNFPRQQPRWWHVVLVVISLGPLTSTFILFAFWLVIAGPHISLPGAQFPLLLAGLYVSGRRLAPYWVFPTLLILLLTLLPLLGIGWDEYPSVLFMPVDRLILPVFGISLLTLGLLDYWRLLQRLQTGRGRSMPQS